MKKNRKNGLLLRGSQRILITQRLSGVLSLAFLLFAGASVGSPKTGYGNGSIFPSDVQKQVTNSKTTQGLKEPESGSFVASQQSKVVVKGKVTATDGSPLPGVSVSIKGTPIGVITDVNGEYQITLPKSARQLQYSFVGMKYQLIAINGQREINVSLLPDTKDIDEVVVVGYGSQKRVNLSGAVESVSSKVLENRPIINTGYGLQGVIPNLNITVNNGRAIDVPSFNVRGFTSLNGGDPLILVDNVPLDTYELSRINPNDIASVSVLKDAAASAIYGARAAFGVVLITTKSAKSNKLSVSANVNYSIRTLGKVPEIVTDPYTVMQYKHDAGTPLYNLYPEEARAYAKKRSEDPSLPAVIIDPQNSQRWAYYGSTNWLHEAYKNTAPSYDANVNISKKDDKSSYLLSAEYFRQDGMFRYGNDTYNRYNLRGKADFLLLPWLKIGSNTTLDYGYYNEPDFDGAAFFHNINRTNSLDVLKNPDGSWTQSGASALGRLQSGGRDDTWNNEFQTTFSGELSLLKDCWSINGDATFRRENQYYKAFDVPVMYKTGPSESTIGYVGSNPSWAKDWAYYLRYNVFNVYTDFHKELKGGHFIQALLGYNQEYKIAESFSALRSGLVSNQFPSIDLATGDKNIGEDIDDWSVRGAFYRVNYRYHDKYIFEADGRFDGSSRFPKNDRFGFFPSASLAWVLSSEGFMDGVKDFTKMDFLKFRGSYGSLGNQNVGSYAYIPEMSSYQSSMILDGQYPLCVDDPSLVSKSLTWEKVSTVNGGIDMEFFKNRLLFLLDVYNRYTKGMLVKGKTLPAVLGAGEPQMNAGNLKTQGEELSVQWKDNFMLCNSPFNWSVRFILADSKTFITKYDNPDKSLYDYYDGEELGTIWGLVTEGFFQTKEELKTHADQTAVGSDDQSYLFDVGDLKFKDINKDGKVNRGQWTLKDHGDFVKIGNSSSRYPFSIDLNAAWKGFDLRTFFQGIGKRDWYPDPNNHYFWGIYCQPWTNVQTLNLNHWSPSNPNGYFPRVKAYIAEDESELGMPQTRYLQNAAYIRMKNLTLGYTLPASLLKSLKIEKLRIYFSGENLFSYSKIKANLDPEGLGGKLYPFQHTFSFGMNLNF